MARLPYCLAALPSARGPLPWRRLLPCLLFAIFLQASPPPVRAQARFDLEGPKIDIHVTRAGISLPIAAVPNLQPGDEIWLHPDLPPTQSVHYLLIAVFLRGTTNPPPENWFTRVETWQRKVREEGVSITVPAEAQQAVLFLAPETGGDFATLRSAVRGRPGVFVRASQDLTEAGFEQSRIDAYLEAMKKVASADPAEIQLHSNLLARTLNLRPNPDCFKRPLDQQYNCLTQTGTQSLLDDGHGQSLLTSLSTGPSSDFINAASTTRLAAGGNYSAYVGALVDFAHILATLHTAQYQYIPGLATPHADALNLRLNTPPSFHNPKSVIVIGLPAIQKSVAPPLRPADPGHISCLLDPHFTLPVEGAPLVFSTAFAHALVLHIDRPQPAGIQSAGIQPTGIQLASAAPEDIPLLPDAFSGGLVLAPAQPTRHELPTTPVPSLGSQPQTTAPSIQPKPPSPPGAPIVGTIEGIWGFDRFTGPAVALQQTPGTGWRIVATQPEHPDQNNAQPPILIAGQPNRLQLLSTGTACIQSIAMEPGATAVTFQVAATASKPTDAKPAEVHPATEPEPVPLPARAQPVDLTLNLQRDTTPGALHLAILQFGQKTPDQLGAQTFAEPAKIDSLTIHAGDRTAILTGTSLDQVASLTTQEKNLTFAPQPSGATPNAQRSIELALAPEAKTPNLKPNERISAEVHLADGRKLPLTATILPPRPAVTLLSRRATSDLPSAIQLTSPNDLALGAQLHFFLKSKEPFPRNEQIEIANLDETLHTTLTIAGGALILQDAHTILATFDPLKLFGPSTFGPFRFRAIMPAPEVKPESKPETKPEPTPGEWLPLATIVRLPTLTVLTCPPLPARGSKPAARTAPLLNTPSPSTPGPTTASSAPPSPSGIATAPASTGATTPTVSPTTPAPGATCTLTGDNLFLLDSVSPTLAYTDPTPVPEGFVDSTLTLSRPPTPTIYLKLRDDPATTQSATLPITPIR